MATTDDLMQYNEHLKKLQERVAEVKQRRRAHSPSPSPLNVTRSPAPFEQEKNEIVRAVQLSERLREKAAQDATPTANTPLASPSTITKYQAALKEVEELSATVTKLQREQADVHTMWGNKVKDLRDELENCRKELSLHEQDQNDTKKRLESLEDQITKLQNDNRMLQEELIQQKKQKDECAASLQSANVSLSAARDKLHSAQEEAKEREELLRLHDKAMSDLETKLEAATCASIAWENRSREAKELAAKGLAELRSANEVASERAQTYCSVATILSDCLCEVEMVVLNTEEPSRALSSMRAALKEPTSSSTLRCDDVNAAMRPVVSAVRKLREGSRSTFSCLEECKKTNNDILSSWEEVIAENRGLQHQLEEAQQQLNDAAREAEATKRRLVDANSQRESSYGEMQSRLKAAENSRDEHAAEKRRLSLKNEALEASVKRLTAELQLQDANNMIKSRTTSNVSDSAQRTFQLQQELRQLKQHVAELTQRSAALEAENRRLRMDARGAASVSEQSGIIDVRSLEVQAAESSQRSNSTQDASHPLAPYDDSQLQRVTLERDVAMERARIQKETYEEEIRKMQKAQQHQKNTDNASAQQALNNSRRDTELNNTIIALKEELLHTKQKLTEVTSEREALIGALNNSY